MRNPASAGFLFSNTKPGLVPGFEFSGAEDVRWPVRGPKSSCLQRVVVRHTARASSHPSKNPAPSAPSSRTSPSTTHSSPRTTVAHRRPPRNTPSAEPATAKVRKPHDAAIHPQERARHEAGNRRDWRHITTRNAAERRSSGPQCSAPTPAHAQTGPCAHVDYPAHSLKTAFEFPLRNSVDCSGLRSQCPGNLLLLLSRRRSPVRRADSARPGSRASRAIAGRKASRAGLAAGVAPGARQAASAAGDEVTTRHT